MTLRTLNYGSYGIFLIMGHAGFCPSTVSGVISKVTIIITHIRGLITLLIPTHEPPSRGGKV